MLRKLLKFSLAFVIVAAGFYFAKDYVVFGKRAYVQNSPKAGEDEDENVDGIAAAMSYWTLRTANPATGTVDTAAAYAAFHQAEMQSFSKNGTGSNLHWTEMGPDNIGGRCRAIIIDKDSNNVVYAAGVTGGIFKSEDAGATWNKVGANPIQNENASALCQSADGDIYYGTGENAFLIPNTIKASANSAPGYFGEGIFKSTNHGTTFTQLASTDPDTKGTQWMDVSFMAADPTDSNRLYAGNDATLEISDDAGATWKSAGGAWGTSACKDIRLSSDGKTIYVVMMKGAATPGSNYHIWRSTDRGSTWAEIGTNSGNVVPSSSSGMMLAIAPSNENTIYVSVANPYPNYSFAGIYRSDDGGNTWTPFIKGDVNFNPLAGQGFYDNCITVDPNNNNKVYFGGLNLYSAEKVGSSVQTNQMTNWESAQGYPNYVHADQHIIVFDHAKPYPSAYFGCDGGVFKSNDVANPNVPNPTFGNADYGFNTTQFYGFGVGPDYPTHVIAGAQDNGEIDVRASGITLLDGAEIQGGDAGYSEISSLNPSMYLEEYTEGNISRSFSSGAPGSWSSFMGETGIMAPAPSSGDYSFIAWLSLWESANDPTSVDSVTFNDPAKAHAAGTTISVQSANGVTFNYVLKQDLPAKTDLRIQDPTQSKLFVPDVLGDIWMTRDILDKSIAAPIFYKIASIPNFVPLMVRCTPDGNTAFAVGKLGGSAAIYRITGLSGKIYQYKNSVLSSFHPDSIGIVTTQMYLASGQVGTGVAIDDNDPNHILFCTGTYDRTNSHVFECDNALDSVPAFTNITANMPSLPVYDVLINSHNSKNYYAATDLGVYSTENSGASWAEDNNGMERVPVSMLRQHKYLDKPWDGPYIYCSTFGRGMYYSSTLTTGIDPSGNAQADKLKMDIYPNPVHGTVNVNVDLTSLSQVSVNIYDIEGKLLSAHQYSNQPSGHNVFSIGTSNLKEGTYFVRVTANGTSTNTEKMLVLN